MMNEVTSSVDTMSQLRPSTLARRLLKLGAVDFVRPLTPHSTLESLVSVDRREDAA